MLCCVVARKWAINSQEFRIRWLMGGDNVITEWPTWVYGIFGKCRGMHLVLKSTGGGKVQRWEEGEMAGCACADAGARMDEGVERKSEK